jgi:predicted CXXCH cytochrome family protein
MRITWVTILFTIAVLAGSGLRQASCAVGGVVNSPHNLSVSGGKGAHGIAYDEIRVCVFCHTPHNALQTSSLAPLWNRPLPNGGGYVMYQSDSYNLKVTSRSNVPTGASRVCLSCHDGTLALNSYGGKILKAGSSGNTPTTMPSDPVTSRNSNLTTDLSDDHPISFEYSATLASQAQLVQAAALPPAVRLDRNNNLQCTACHDPHDNSYGNFLVLNNGDSTKPDYNPTVSSPLCVACHAPTGWNSSSPHYAGAGCLNCHVTHGAPVKQYLLAAPVDQLCFNGTGCHGTGTPAAHPSSSLISSKKSAGSASIVTSSDARNQFKGIAANNLQTVFDQSPYKHPIGTSGKTYRKVDRLPHREVRVECADCHNSHVAGSGSQSAMGIKRSLRQVSGVSKDTLAAVQANTEYEICYKCHSGPYAYKFAGPRKTDRVIYQPDLMRRFDAANPSFHPVAVTRRSGNGRSLLANYQNGMLTITCTDCHNSDQSKRAGGEGPNGPHGSRYEHILIARYDMPVKGTAGRNSSCGGYQNDYALCFACHSDIYVMASGSYFANGSQNEHARHVVDRCIPCAACHDPHGVSAQDGGSATGNAHLINFDRTWAASASLPLPRYQTTGSGSGSGSCTVSCHTGGTHSYRR